jgi:hypothetical protein
MPSDSSLAIINGLNLNQRPVIQSYAAFTPWLDAQNAHFLSSGNASEFILYVMRSTNGVDQRPSAWDESISKRALIQNYAPSMEFQTTERLFVNTTPEPAIVMVLRHSLGAWEYESISTNAVTLSLDQPLDIPPSTNFEFLWLDAERTPCGKMAALASQPCELTATFEYSDGTSKDYRAVLPILETGVLINYRVESPEEIRHWLYSAMNGNVTAQSIRFKSASPWAFQRIFHGKIITCRLVNRRIGEPIGPTER